MANLSNINDKFLVTTGGNVLIGQTAAVGSSILQVTGNSTFAGSVTGTLARFDTLNNNANSANIIYRSGTNTIVGNNASALVVQDGGNVGIGTDSPNVSGVGSESVVLSVIETSGNRRGILELGDNQNADTGGIGSINFVGTYQDAGHKIMAEIRASGSGATSGQRGSSISMYTKENGTANIAERMRIDDDGNVGIGTTDPTSQLFVSDTVDGDKIRWGRSAFPSISVLVGSLGTYNGVPYIGYQGGAGGGIMFNGSSIEPTALGSSRTSNTNDIGSPSYKWRNLYLGGGVYLGGTGSANLLDDYEEGTWTPAVSGSTTAGTATYGSQGGSYTKIGNKVTCWFSITNFTQSGAAGNFTITGLPFTCITTSSVRGCFSSNLRFYNMPFSGDLPVTSLSDNNTSFIILWSRNNTTWIGQPVSNTGNQYIEGYVTYSTA